MVRQSCVTLKTLMAQLTEDKMTTFTSEDRQEAYQKKVEEAPYHPGYEDAVIAPTPKYVGMDPAKMLWKPKPLSDEEMKELINNFPIIFSPQDLLTFARAIEERHGIK